MTRSRRPTPLVTHESLQHMIDVAERIEDHQERQRRLSAIVGRALVRIFERQTEDEKRSNDTNRHNSIGFTGADGKSGCLAAKSFLKNNHMLQEWQIERWTRRGKNGFSRICKYSSQLNEIALEQNALAARAVELKQQELV